jgi:hypothetical protein
VTQQLIQVMRLLMMKKTVAARVTRQTTKSDLTMFFSKAGFSLPNPFLFSVDMSHVTNKNTGPEICDRL